jgi:WD40 repeat protein
VAWNCLGKKLASGSVDQTARIWHIEPHGHSKAKDMELKGHTDSVDQLCWDPKHGDLLATASGDKTVRLWDARSEYSWLMCFPSLLFPGCISQRIISLLQTTTLSGFFCSCIPCSVTTMSQNDHFHPLFFMNLSKAVQDTGRKSSYDGTMKMAFG